MFKALWYFGYMSFEAKSGRGCQSDWVLHFEIFWVGKRCLKNQRNAIIYWEKTLKEMCLFWKNIDIDMSMSISWPKKFPQRPTCSISPAYIKAVPLGLAWRNQSGSAHVITLSSSKLLFFLFWMLNIYFQDFVSFYLMEGLKTDNRTGARYYIRKGPCLRHRFYLPWDPCRQLFCVGSQKNCLRFEPNFVTGFLIPFLREPKMQSDPDF